MNAATRISAFVVEHAAAEPIAKRALLYRDLAELMVEEQLAERLTALAIDCERIELNCQQLVLDFKRRNGGRG